MPHLTCTDARRVRPPRSALPAYPHSPNPSAFRTHGACVLNTYEIAIGYSRKIPIDEDARTVRPYRSSGNSLVYLGNPLVYSYLVNLSTKSRVKSGWRGVTKKRRVCHLTHPPFFEVKCLLFFVSSNNLVLTISEVCYGSSEED